MTDEELTQVQQMIDSAVTAAIQNERKQKNMEYVFISVHLVESGTDGKMSTEWTDHDDEFEECENLSEVFAMGWQIKQMLPFDNNATFVTLERPRFLRTL